MIILCGIKHCGKSTIGKKLSLALGEVFIDVDSVIENIAECFRKVLNGAMQ